MGKKLDELMDDFYRIENVAEGKRSELSSIKGKISVKKEDYQKRKEELKEKGITFESSDELTKIYKERKERVEEKLEHMASKLGISEDDDYDDDDF